MPESTPEWAGPAAGRALVDDVAQDVGPRSGASHTYLDAASPALPTQTRYSPADGGPVDSSQISVVIQGPLYRNVEGRPDIGRCLEAIKRVLPDAETIVATWRSEDLVGVDADKVVALDDPGSLTDIRGNIISIARQDLSTREGLKLASRPWALKMRADVILHSAGVVRSASFGKDVPSNRRLFSAPVSVLTLYSRDPARAPFLFHPSDIIQFGATEDLRQFWSGPSFSEADIFGHSPRAGIISGWTGFTRQRVVPEQALMLRWLTRHGLVANLETTCTTAASDMTLSEQVLLSNFRLLEADAVGVELPRHLVCTAVAVATVYRAAQAEQIARQAYENPKMRRLAIWLRKYVLFPVTPFWWVVATHLLLHQTAPSLLRSARNIYRRFRR